MRCDSFRPPAVLLFSLFSCLLLLGPAGRRWVYTHLNVGQHSLALGFVAACCLRLSLCWRGLTSLAALWRSDFHRFVKDPKIRLLSSSQRAAQGQQRPSGRSRWSQLPIIWHRQPQTSTLYQEFVKCFAAFCLFSR